MGAQSLCAGCGEKTVIDLPKYSVSGTVLVDGKPTAGVMVILSPSRRIAFLSSNARTASGRD